MMGSALPDSRRRARPGGWLSAASGGVGSLLLGLLFLTAAPSLSGQVTVRDFVLSAGGSAEGYRGNLPAVSVPVTDSSEVVSAVAGELALRTNAEYQTAGNGLFSLAFDGGVRQFAASGFEQGDYSPREWVGTLDLAYARTLGSRAGIQLRTRLRGRDIRDRPPMPLFLQPGYRSGDASLALDFDGSAGVVYEVRLEGSKSDFLAPAFAPQVRLLDREAAGFEAGALISGTASTLRIFAGLEASRYPKQATFAPEDPYRRDRTFQGGALWTRQTNYLVQLGIEGRANRSNSRRPEYDAFTVRGLFTTSLPEGVSLSLYGAFTEKRYLHPSEFARLLPGDEADNATLAYLSLSRAILPGLDGAVRMGWTRAETEIGDAYFERFGGAVFLHFRPDL